MRMSGTGKCHKEKIIPSQCVAWGAMQAAIALPEYVRILLQKSIRFAYDFCET